MTTEEVARNIASILDKGEIDPNFVFPNTVDDLSIEDPSMSLTDYDEIFSTRISYGGSELYDIYIARKK